MKRNDNIPKHGEERKGFWRIGYLENQDYPRRVFELTRKQIDSTEINELVDKLILEKKEAYFDESFGTATEKNAVYVFFPTGQKAYYRNKDIMAGFHRLTPNDRWKGVYLEQDLDILKMILENQRKRSALEDYTYIYDYNHITKIFNEEFEENKTVEECANFIGELFTTQKKNGNLFSFPMGSYFPANKRSFDGRPMFFWMENNDKYQAKQEGFGINLVDEKQLLEIWCNFQHKYTLGSLVFQTWESMERFVGEVAQAAMPENWNRMYSASPESQYGYPVLKSYLEYTLIRLQYLDDDDKDENNHGYILRENGKMYYNTGLLNKFFRQILVGADLKTIKQMVPGLGSRELEFYYDPYIIVSGHDTKFPTESGLLDFPKLANYFDNKENILYDTSLEIMLNDEHIFEDGLAEGRIPMFREEYALCKENSEELKNLHIRVQARIQIAIQRARLLAERNHKLAVPQFWKEKNEVQFLLPLYMEEAEYTGRPQCALALRKSKNSRYYEGATILSLDMAYSNARLIAKPDVTWLNRGIKDYDNGYNTEIITNVVLSDTPIIEKEIVPYSPVINDDAPKKLPAPKVNKDKKETTKESSSESKVSSKKQLSTTVLPNPKDIGKTATLTNIRSRPSGKGLRGNILNSTGTIAKNLLKHPVPHYTKGNLKVKIVNVNPQGNQYILEPID